MTMQEFIKEFKPILAAFGNDKTGDEIIEAYFVILQRFSTSDFKKAVIEILETHKYNTLPKPADFIEIMDGSKAKALNAEHEAINAWEWADFARSYHGIYKSVFFENPKITQTIFSVFGDWVSFCDSKDGLKNDMRNFINYYKLISDDFVAPQKGVYLKGQFEIDGRLDFKNAYIAIVGKNANESGQTKLSYKEFENRYLLTHEAIKSDLPIKADEVDSKIKSFLNAVKSAVARMGA